MSHSRFDSYNRFLRRFHRHVIVGWILVLLLAALFIPSFFSSVSFGVSGASLSIPNAESAKAQNILDTQFPSSANSSANSIIVVVQQNDVYSNATKAGILAVNQSVSEDQNVEGFTGMQSLYTTEYGLLDETIPEFVSAVAALSSNVTTINAGLYSLQQNITEFSTALFTLQAGVNSTAQLVYGVPAAFVQAWSEALAPCGYDAMCANDQANSAVAPTLQGQALGYYETFFQVWNATFQASPNPTTPSPLVREQTSVGQTVTALLSNPALNSTTKQVFEAVSAGLNVTDWYQSHSVGALSVNLLASELPSTVAAALGMSAHDLVQQVYQLGPRPSSSSLSALTLALFEKGVENMGGGTGSIPGLGALPVGSNFSMTQLVQEAYAMGPSPAEGAAWGLSSGVIANAAAALLSSSPLFSINSTSLRVLLSAAYGHSSPGQVQSLIGQTIVHQSYPDYPLVLSRSITDGLVSADNSTALLVLTFSSPPSRGTIHEVHSIVHSSNLAAQGPVYVTGSSVLSEDLSNMLGPAVGTTTVVGGLVALLIAVLLFLAPLAAITPLLIAGVSIAVSLGVIDFVKVVIERTQVNFITPVLTILVLLGLAVDYSVLQLRRTREERLNGRSKEESVALSVRWAGEAVITAALTVIVAYVVLAVAHIPFFGDVGTAIAIGVSILLVASVTLLPSLELAAGDRLFWPSLHRTLNGGTHKAKKERLYRLTQATLKRKVAVAAVIALCAGGSFYLVLHTPTGIDLVQLLPNFESNQGLTILTSSFGGAASSPAQIVITTPTPIVSGANQFNQTLLAQIDEISATAAGTGGVVSVSGPTRPYGAPFNYTEVANTSGPVASQYVAGMVQSIGKNNETALITVGFSTSAESAQAIATLEQLKSEISALHLPKGVTVYYAGDTQSTYDAASFINGLLPEVVTILAAAVYVILFLQLRSAFLPFQLVFTILSAAVFALAVLSIVYFRLLGLPILNFSILFVVVTMLGVGTDYDIFLVTRIREETFVNGKPHEEAIKQAISKVWVTVLGLGLILASVFASLMFTGIALLSELGLTVASAVVLDVGGIILFFVPALMGLAEKYNWWPSKAKEGPAAP